MAGNYPDVPSWRMAYDRDGTQVFTVDPGTGAITQVSSASISNMNDEDGDDFLTHLKVAVLFPELRDLDAFWIWYYWIGWSQPQVSVDTTNGFDGTWTSLGSITGQNDALQPHYRTNIQSTTALGIRGIRFQGGSGAATTRFIALHLYGEPAPGENPDRLMIVKADADERVAPAFFDWGNVPRGSTADKTFRVKNLSPTLTASSIRVAMEAPTNASPSTPGQHSLSTDGTNFLAQVNIGNLAPGAISGPITLRRSMATNAQLGLHAFRLFAEAASWGV